MRGELILRDPKRNGTYELTQTREGTIGLAATYGRVSTEDQAEGTSLDTQTAECVTLAEANGYQVPLDYRIRDRLRELAQERSIEAIAYHSADRLSRDSIDLMILLREFQRAGVKVYAVHNPPSDDPLGRAVTFMQGTFAELERRVIVERTMRAKRAIAKGGRMPQGTGAGLYGYDYDRSAKTRSINHGQAEIVRRIFVIIGEGQSLHGAATLLNREGYRTVSGARWHPQGIRRLVTNPAYAGRTYYGRTKRIRREGQLVGIEARTPEEWIEIPGVTPAIVSKAEFDRAKAALGQPKKRLTRPPQNYLLRGHISCGDCGGPMTGTILSKRYRYYQCVNARSSTYRPATCSARYVPAEPLEGSVWPEVVKILEDPSVVFAELDRRRASAEPYREADVTRITRELKTLDRQRERILRLARFEDFDDAQIEAELRDIRTRVEALEQERATIEASRRSILSLNSDKEAVAKACARVKERLGSMTYEWKRFALDAIGAKVVATPEGSTLHGYLPSYVTIARTSG